MRTFLLLGGYLAGASLLWLAVAPGRAPFGAAAPKVESPEADVVTHGRRLAEEETEAGNSEAMSPPAVASHLRKVIPANATFESKVSQANFFPGSDEIACVTYGYGVMMTPCCARCEKKSKLACASAAQQVLGGGTVPFRPGTSCPQALAMFNSDPNAYVQARHPSATIFGLEPWQFSMCMRILTQLVYGAIYFYCIMVRYPYFMGPSEASARLQCENEVCATISQTRCSICCLSMFCSGPRAAHTFAVTGTCAYWPSLIIMSICPCPMLWWANSCTDLNVKLGARKRKDPCSGAACAFCCSCCVIAQDAEALDLATGAQTGCCGVDPPPMEMQQMQAQMQQGFDPYYQQGQYPPTGYPPQPYQQPYQQGPAYGQQYPGYAMPYGQEMQMQGQGSLCCCSASPPVPPMPQPAPYRPAYSAAY
jgi:hypothetical protein